MPGTRLYWTLVFIDLEAGGAFVIPPTGLPEEPASFSESMRLSDEDEARSYRAWRRGKGGR